MASTSHIPQSNYESIEQKYSPTQVPQSSESPDLFKPSTSINCIPIISDQSSEQRAEDLVEVLEDNTTDNAHFDSKIVSKIQTMHWKIVKLKITKNKLSLRFQVNDLYQ